VGALGVRRFNKGLYTYTGSALGSTLNLRSRIARHLRKTKKRQWHIDYILEEAQVLAVIYCINPKRVECSIVQALGNKAGVEATVRGFGASDCTRRCRAHLYYYSEGNVDKLTQLVDQAYRETGCETAVFTGALL
jgi:Uri superfamily endonuclease